VTRAELTKIVEAGVLAPSGCNAQTTSFVIVDDPVLIQGIAGVLDKQVVRESKAVIVCLVEHREVFFGMSFGVEDCSAAVENILLATTALGLATVWIDGALRREGRAAKIAGLLGIPSDREVQVVLPIGEPSGPPAPIEKLALESRAWFNRYGGQHGPES
jgi:nitroreductase